MGTIQERWAEHCRDYKRERCEQRPLYSAMNKYGIENFKIEEIEECSDQILNERECFWIEYYGSFKNGYNATLGGDGKAYLDYDLIVSTYKQLQNITETSKKLQVCEETVRKILRLRQISIVISDEVIQKKLGIMVNQYDLHNNFIQTFPSLQAAAKALGKMKSKKDRGAASHIGEVCRGKRKTAYGFIWKFAE